MKRHVVDFIEFLDGRALSYHIKMKSQNGWTWKGNIFFKKIGYYI